MATTNFSALKQSGLSHIKITDKQRKFVSEYIQDFNATRAARAAGYKNPEVIGRRMVNGKDFPKVAQTIALIQAQNLEKSVLTKDQIVEELSYAAMRDPLDIFNSDGEGRFVVKDLNEIPPAIRRTIDSIKCKDIRDKKGDVIGHEVEVTLTKRLDAINMLMKHFGMFKEEIEVKHTMDWDQLYERQAKIPDNNDVIEDRLATLEGQARPHVPKLKGPKNGQGEKPISQEAGKRNQRKESGSKSKTLGGKTKAKRKTPK